MRQHPPSLSEAELLISLIQAKEWKMAQEIVTQTPVFLLNGAPEQEAVRKLYAEALGLAIKSSGTLLERLFTTENAFITQFDDSIPSSYATDYNARVAYTREYCLPEKEGAGIKLALKLAQSANANYFASLPLITTLIKAGTPLENGDERQYYLEDEKSAAQIAIATRQTKLLIPTLMEAKLIFDCFYSIKKSHSENAIRYKTFYSAALELVNFYSQNSLAAVEVGVISQALAAIQENITDPREDYHTVLEALARPMQRGKAASFFGAKNPPLADLLIGIAKKRGATAGAVPLPTAPAAGAGLPAVPKSSDPEDNPSAAKPTL